MEGENMDMGGSGGNGANQQVNSRWNPTKEQISLLENMYMQGIRTPTAEQIQQITTRLKAYGHIEGKNVFYWFQNHKARQRQKQKQENFAYINRFLHYHHHPVFSPRPNVVCSSYFHPHSELGFYPQYPFLLPSSFKRRPRTTKINEKKTVAYAIPRENENIMIGTNHDCKSYTSNVETLPLFPLRPTSILEGREATTNAVNSLGSTSDFAEDSINATSTTPLSCCSEEIATGVEDCFKDKPFFDFFSGQGDDQEGPL